MHEKRKSVTGEWFRGAVFFVAMVVSACAASTASNPFSAKQESPYRDLDSLQEETILHVPTGIDVTRTQLLDFLSRARIVYIGEAHTNLLHHRIQLDILKGLEERFSGEIAVGMEMFARPLQPHLDRWSRGEMDEKSFAKIWHANWSQDFEYYGDILRFIRDKRIPLIGLNASDEQVQIISQKGLEGLSDTARRDIPAFDPADPYHRLSMEVIFGGHNRGNRGFDRFYQTMLLWDETMANSIVEYLKSPEGQGKRIVILAGGFHVRYGFGIPRRVFRRLPEPYAIVLPYTSRIPEGKEYLIMDITLPDLPLYIADFVWAVGYEDLEDERVR